MVALSLWVRLLIVSRWLEDPGSQVYTEIDAAFEKVAERVHSRPQLRSAGNKQLSQGLTNAASAANLQRDLSFKL
jgi:hypothetical protein